MKQSWLTRAQWAVSPQIPSPGPPRADSAVISIRVCSRMWRKSHFSELLSGKVQDVVRKNTLEAAQVEVWAGGGRSHITKGNNRCSSDRGWRSNDTLGDRLVFNQSDGHPWGQRAIAQDSGGETATARRSHEWEEA